MQNGERQPSQQAGSKYDGNVNDWAEALKDVDPSLSTQLNEKRSRGFENLEKLNLPRYKRKTIGLADFLKNPDETLSDMQSNLFYITILPKKEGLNRFSKSGIDASGVNAYLLENIRPDLISDYDIVVQQYFENLYGGNIVVNPSGQIYIEFKTGKQGPIAKGTQTPEFTVENDNFTNSLKYSFEDENLRKMIYRTLQTIPHLGEGREIKYTPGYYEFIVVKKDKQSLEEPVFIDYRDNPAYHLPEQN